jgi:hypothetical protein
MPLDDGRMTETYCGTNIRGDEEELLSWRTLKSLINIVLIPVWDETEYHSSVYSIANSAYIKTN